MTARNPGFCTEVVKVNPHRRWFACGHRVDKALGQMAGKGFNDHVAGIKVRKVAWPMAYFDSLNHLQGFSGIDFRVNPLERNQIINP